MPTPQEQELARLQGLEKVLMGNPAIKDKFGRLLKEADPKINVPWVEQDDRLKAALDERLKEHEAKVQELQRALYTKEAEERNARDIARLKRMNLDSEDIDQIQKIVADKNKEGELLSLDTAAKYYLASRSPVPARSVGSPFGGTNKYTRPKDDWRKQLRQHDSPLMKAIQDKRVANQYLREQSDLAWDEGLEIINSQQNNNTGL